MAPRLRSAQRVRMFRALPRVAAFIAVAILIASSASAAQQDIADPAAALHARYIELNHALENSTIQRGVVVESIDSARAPRGDAYAIIDYPFARVAEVFSKPDTLCDWLILHLNVQYCRAAMDDEPPVLSIALGKKTNQSLEDTHRIRLDFSVSAPGVDFMRMELAADEGPLGTGDYLIALELIALDEERAFMHIRYSYTQGFLARLATSIYFSTSGRDKVGFTSIQDDADEPPELVRGVRGAIERNTMRYYLAFDAYLHAAPGPQRFDESIERWFAATERFARQLREVPHADYIAMKRGQFLRQQTAQ